MYLCVHVRCICVIVRVCVCVVRVPVRASVHKVKIYHRSGTFNCVLCLNHAGLTLPIEIEADSGRPGRMAAHDLYLQLKQAGAQVSKPTLYRDDSDPADRFNRATI